MDEQPVVRPAPAFDYEAKHWGTALLRPRPWYMNGLKLCYLLDDLSGVKGRVLDVGCGGGSVAKAVKHARPDLEVFGCDLSESALKIAGSNPGGVDFRPATPDSLPFRTATPALLPFFAPLQHSPH